MTLDKDHWLAIKGCVFLLSLSPLVLLSKAAIQNQLGANKS
jgi:sulfoxide reductase heme-binding subunit YedZ